MKNLPDLVDAHVHIGSPGWQDAVLHAGVGAVRDAGMQPSCRQQAHRHERPRVVSSCWALYKEGGYGSRFGTAVSPRSGIGPEIARLKEAGADIIKTMASGMVSLKQPGHVTAGGFDSEELHIIVREAAAAGLGVMAHANGEPAIMAAARAGVRSIEHGFFMTEQALDLLCDRGIFWVPTTGALVRAARTAGVSEEAQQFVSDLAGRHLRMIRAAHDRGVQLAAGTDCVLPDRRYGEAYQEELTYFRQAGLSEEEVSRIATVNGARLLGLQH